MDLRQKIYNESQIKIDIPECNFWHILCDEEKIQNKKCQ
jgi:hypothetical protein